MNDPYIYKTEEIGTEIDLSKGKYVNTEYKDGKVALKIRDYTVDGEPIYYEEGYYESEVIDMIGKFSDFKHVARNIETPENGSYEIMTKSSEDNRDWDDYVPLQPDTDLIDSPVARYVQIKVILYASRERDTRTALDFKPEDEKMFERNYNVKFNNKLTLDFSPSMNMDYDDTWDDEGHLFRLRLNSNDVKRIDSLRAHIVNG